MICIWHVQRHRVTLEVCCRSLQMLLLSIYLPHCGLVTGCSQISLVHGPLRPSSSDWLALVWGFRMLPVWEIPSGGSADLKPRLESSPLPGVVNSPFLLAIRYKGEGGDLFPGWFNVKKRILAVHTVEHYRGASADKLLQRTWQQTINCQQISLPYYGVCPLFKTLSINNWQQNWSMHYVPTTTIACL